MTSVPRFRVRDIMPKGLYWRTLLIIVAPAALLQLIITVIFLDDHWQATSKRMSQGVAADVALLIQLYEREPTPARLAEVQDFGKALNLDVAIARGPLEGRRCGPGGSVIDRYLDKGIYVAPKTQVGNDRYRTSDQV